MPTIIRVIMPSILMNGRVARKGNRPTAEQQHVPCHWPDTAQADCHNATPEPFSIGTRCARSPLSPHFRIETGHFRRMFAQSGEDSMCPLLRSSVHFPGRYANAMPNRPEPLSTLGPHASPMPHLPGMHSQNACHLIYSWAFVLCTSIFMYLYRGGTVRIFLMYCTQLTHKMYPVGVVRNAGAYGYSQ